MSRMGGGVRLHGAKAGRSVYPGSGQITSKGPAEGKDGGAKSQTNRRDADIIFGRREVKRFKPYADQWNRLSIEQV